MEKIYILRKDERGYYAVNSINGNVIRIGYTQHEVVIALVGNEILRDETV